MRELGNSISILMLQSRPGIAEVNREGFISLVGLTELKRSSPEFLLLLGRIFHFPVSFSQL